MSFESAVAIAQIIGVLASLLWLTLPVTAVVCILRLRRYRPGSSNRLAYGVLGAWLCTVVACVMSLVSGAWYGENGPPPLIAAIGAAMLLLILAAIHFVLIQASALPKKHNRDSS